MRSLGVLVLVGALLALLAGCSTEVSEKDVDSDQLDIEVGRKDFVNGESLPEPD